ncbi:molecular chaperone [Vibrio cholerae]
MKIDINNSFFPKESVLNNPNSSTDTITNLDIDSAEKKIDAINQDDTLISVLEKQREAVRMVSPRNVETDISNSLLESINNSALELEILNGWTEGGKAMFSSIISGMFDEMLKGGINGIELEDTLQLVILELMVNADSYGLSEWINKPDIKACIEHLLESVGSASHGLHEHENGWDKVETLAKASEYFLTELNKKGPFQSTTLLGRLIGAADFNRTEGIKKLYDQINNNYHNGDGWLIYEQNQQNGTSAATKLSPLITLMIMSDVLKQFPDITRQQMLDFLSCDINKIESILSQTLKSPSNINEWITQSPKWQIQLPNLGDKGGHGGQLDWIGNGLNLGDLENIYSNFPSRVLSDEDIKELNRIGDNVKMIMQTLKYWFQILRDERVAIARNI